MLWSHEATLLRDKQSLLRDKQSLLCDKQSVLRDKQSVLRDKQSLLRDKQSLVRDKQSLLCDEQTLLRGKATFVSDEEALLRRRNTYKHQPLNKRRTYHGHKTHPSSFVFHARKRPPDRGNHRRRHHRHDRQQKLSQPACRSRRGAGSTNGFHRCHCGSAFGHRPLAVAFRRQGDCPQGSIAVMFLFGTCPTGMRATSLID